MIVNIDFKNLIYSVTYYLSYQDKIGKSFMIDESSLKYPVAEYLSSLKIPLSSIALEYAHPHLKKRQIDLVKLNDTKNIELAFEFKMARKQTRYDSERQRIFNDLMRMYFTHKYNTKKCYFMIAGKQNDFIQNFRSIVTKKPSIDKKGNQKNLPQPQGFYTEWFGFKPQEIKTFKVKEAPNADYESIYYNFLQEYKAKNDKETLELPEVVTTKCIAISALSPDYPTPYVGGIWEIV